MKFFGSYNALMGLYHGQKLEEMGPDGGTAASGASDNSGDPSGNPGSGDDGAGQTGDDPDTSTAESTQSDWGLDDLFNLDPFAKDERRPSEDDQSTGDEEQQQAVADNETEVPPGQDQGQQQQAAVEPSDTEKQMMEQMVQMQQTIEALQSGQQQPNQQQNQGQQQEQQDPFQAIVEQYANLRITPELQQMLDSEDPQERSMGLSTLMQGTAIAVHNNLQEYVKGALTNLVNVLPEAIKQVSGDHSARESIKSDFYNTYPQYNRPGLGKFVEDVAIAVAKKRGDKSWNPELREAIHNELQMQLQQFAGGMQQTARQQRSAPQGQYSPGNTARAPIQRNNPNPQDDAVDTFMSTWS